MSDVQIEKVNELYFRVNCEPSIAYELNDHFAFFVPGFKYQPLFKSGRWDGKIRLFNPKVRTIRSGLLIDLIKFLNKNDYSYSINKEDIRPLTVDSYIDELQSKIKFDITGKYAYQWDATKKAIEMNKLLILSSTGSGKSAIIYLLIRYLIETTDKNILIVVPTISLVEQLFGDFEDYVADDFIVSDHVSKKYSGVKDGDKQCGKRVTISTFQSLVRVPASDPLFTDAGALIVDECHLAENKSITSIIDKLPDVPFRIGMSGTIKDAKMNELSLKGLFGPIYQTQTTRNLIDKGVLTDVLVKVSVIEYSEADSKLFYQEIKDFQAEMQWISKHSGRNNKIVDIAMQQTNNTLILFNYVEHGKKLFDIATERNSGSEHSKHVFLITGITPPEERERVRNFTENNKDVLILATSSLFSTGVNIRSLGVLIFAHSFKAKIRNLQSIGRSLRLHNDKEKAIIIDISDKVAYKKHINTSYRHMEERIKLYQDEGFDYMVETIKV